MEGSGGGGPFAAYVEAIRMIFKVGLNDKSAAVRAAAAGCLRAVAMTGGPGVGSGGLEACINLCLKVTSELGRWYSLDGFSDDYIPALQSCTELIHAKMMTLRRNFFRSRDWKTFSNV